MAIDNYEVRFNTTGAPVTEADALVATEPYGTAGGSKSVPHTHGQPSGTTVYYGVRSHDSAIDQYSAFAETSVTLGPISDSAALTYSSLDNAGFSVDGAVTVDWGDGSAVESVSGGSLAIHTYALGPLYTAVVTAQPGQTLSSLMLAVGYTQPSVMVLQSPNLTTMYFDPNAATKKLASIEFRSPTTLVDLGLMFAGQSALTTVSGPLSTAGLSFDQMFFGCGSLESVSGLNTTSATTFNNMFSECRSLTSVSALDISAGTDFGYMFGSCRALTSAPLLGNGLGVSFSSMFYSCWALESVSAIDASRGTNFDLMFGYCFSLTSIEAFGFRYSVDLHDTALDTTALNTFFDNLGTADNTAKQQTVDITGTPGAATCDRNLATAKGWTVTG